MSMSNVKALCFDTGGTILDWHTGVRTAFAAIGVRHGVERDWAGLTNEFRRRSLKLVLNHGEHTPATITFDDAHRDVLDQVLADNGLDVFSEQERHMLWLDAIHSLKCWPDFPDALARLRGKFVCVSFTLLSFRIIMDTARQNGLFWDAVISCEAIGKYTRSYPKPTGPAPGFFSSIPASAAWSPAIIRSQRRQGLRLSDGLRPPPRRMGRGRAARSRARSAAGDRRRKLP
jgi:FMN phosphatase YigB (HAD superfamily)